MKTLYLCGAGNPEGIRLAQTVNEKMSKWDRIVILDDDASKHGQDILGIEIIGGFDELENADRASSEVANLVARTTEKRWKVRKRLQQYRLPFAALIHPSVDLRGVNIDGDITVYPGALLLTGATVGEGSVVLMSGIVGHGCRLGRGCIVGPGAILNARVEVEDRVYVGSNAAVLPDLHIGISVTIGACSAVVDNVPDFASVIGVPGQILVIHEHQSAADTKPETKGQSLTFEPEHSTNQLSKPDKMRSLETDDQSHQARIATIWKDEIGLQNVNSHDNFFDIGGTSLLALKVISRMERELGCKVDIRTLILKTLRQISVEQSANSKSLPSAIFEAFYFGDQEQNIFGVFHQPTSDAFEHAVLLCNPLGYEYMRTHQALKQLAEQLASAGFFVLRFDYSGTGDAYGDGSESRLQSWLHDLSQAVEELKSRSGKSKIALVGLRFGATLAQLFVANRNDIKAVVLWDPVIVGSSYLSEIKSIHKEWLRTILPRPSRKAYRDQQTEVLGFPVSRSLQNDISGIDLTISNETNRTDTMMVVSEESSFYAQYRKGLETNGIDFDYQLLEGADIWRQREGFDSGLIPSRVINSILRWLKKK